MADGNHIAWLCARAGFRVEKKEKRRRSASEEELVIVIGDDDGGENCAEVGGWVGVVC